MELPGDEGVAGEQLIAGRGSQRPASHDNAGQTPPSEATRAERETKAGHLYQGIERRGYQSYLSLLRRSHFLQSFYDWVEQKRTNH